MRIYPFTEAYCRKQATPASSYEDRLTELLCALEEAEAVVIGAGAGLSAAAGLEYGGKRFAKTCADFAARYHIPDMYSAMFYPFKTEEERWAYLARHIRLNRFDNDREAGLYRRLLALVNEKEYFIITTNVDGLFVKAGFRPERIFAVQGDYAYMQCARACHDGLYPDENLVRKMDSQAENCRVPSALIPRCPVCGGPMEIHIRKDGFFVENARWHEDYGRYLTFMRKTLNRRTLLLELGVGYNTPTIIRFPFERLAAQNRNISLVRMNRDHPEKQAAVSNFIPFAESIDRVIEDIETLKKKRSEREQSCQRSANA